MNLIVLTGAGISAESGLATFRSGGGLWAGRRIEEVSTPEALERNPDAVCAFYDERRAEAVKAEPNAAHRALAKLEGHWRETAKGDFLLVTQNVDDLHERAGSQRVIHMHGQLNSALCVECGWHGPRYNPLEDDRECAACGRDALRPDIVLFGEAPREMWAIEAALRTCDLFLAVGTSGAVYPAAGFVEIAKASGAQTNLLNLELPAGSDRFDEYHLGSAGETVPGWVDHVLAVTKAS
jgi:NAD-dependent deacetylase